MFSPRTHKPVLFWFVAKIERSFFPYNLCKYTYIIHVYTATKSRSVVLRIKSLAPHNRYLFLITRYYTVLLFFIAFIRARPCDSTQLQRLWTNGDFSLTIAHYTRPVVIFALHTVWCVMIYWKIISLISRRYCFHKNNCPDIGSTVINARVSHDTRPRKTREDGEGGAV